MFIDNIVIMFNASHNCVSNIIVMIYQLTEIFSFVLIKDAKTRMLTTDYMINDEYA